MRAGKRERIRRERKGRDSFLDCLLINNVSNLHLEPTKMAKIDFDDFGEKEVSRIYLAGQLGEAKRVEKILSANGINYAVEVEPYVTTFAIFSFGEYRGASFYVLSGQAEFCRRILSEAGLKSGILEDSAE